MFTVHLLRNNDLAEPGYAVFATDAAEQVIKPTVYSTNIYIDALIQANAVFDVLQMANKGSVATYIESSYDTPRNVFYTVNELVFRKIPEHRFYASLIEAYQTHRTRKGHDKSIACVQKEQKLTDSQVDILRRLLTVGRDLPILND